MPDLSLLASAIAALTAVGVTMLLWRQAQMIERLRLLAEQALAGTRAEAETTRAALQAIGRDSADRIAALRGSFDVGIEQVRTVLTREQGELRLALAEAQRGFIDQITRQFDTTRETIDAKLKELREGNESKLGEIQKTVNEQLHAAVEKQMAESFNRVIDQFAAVQKAMGDVQAVTAQIGDIKRLFTNVKTRGGWGETQVRAMLDDILPAGAYETNCKLRDDGDDVVEFAVIMPMRGDVRPLLPIDAKFPVEDYERLLAAADAGDDEAARAATRALERRVREEARKIAQKYIIPPRTVEFAVLYLPTDSLYTEVARIPGLIDGIGRDYRVILMGPSLLPALLRTIHLGFITMALEQKADQVRELLGATKTEMERMDQVLERLAKQAGTFSRTIDQARVRTRGVGRKLRGVEALDQERTDLLLEARGDALPAESEDQDMESAEWPSVG